MPGILLDTLNGKRGEQAPLWLMRQAGRYLPEYRELRAEKGGFLELVYDSDAAAEVTIQPIRRFGFDGAILFSDILIIPYAMGQKLEFLAGEGPKLSPKLVDHTLKSLEAVPERLSPIYETVAKVKAGLGPQTTLLGFAGSPWTTVLPGFAIWGLSPSSGLVVQSAPAFGRSPWTSLPSDSPSSGQRAFCACAVASIPCLLVTFSAFVFLDSRLLGITFSLGSSSMFFRLRRVGCPLVGISLLHACRLSGPSS